MTTFTVWKYDSPDQAEHVEDLLRRGAADGLVTIHDTAVISWPTEANRPETSRRHDDARRGVGWGAFWGLLFGTIFLIPLIGAATGAAIGGVSGAFNGLGISDDQIEKIRAQITPGTSALFAVTGEADLDRLGERLHGLGGTLISSNLTDLESKALLQVVD